MAFELSRVDRLEKTYDLAVRFPELTGPFTAASVALLPPRVGPNAATVWYTVAVASGVATVLFAGPDADSTGAVVVTGSADLWLKAGSGPEVDAVKVERITLLGGGTVTAPPLDRGLPIGGTTGQVLTKSSGTAYDAEWDTPVAVPTGGAGGALSGSYPSPGLNASAVEAIVTGSDAVRAAYAHLEGGVLVINGVPVGGSGGGPTLEELERVTLLGTVNATATRRLGPASFDQRIGALSLAVSAAVTASDTNYWTISLQRLRAGQSPLTVVTRTTKTTGGQAFTADQGWTFADMPWLETARHLRAGDVLALVLTKTGTPADLTDLTVSVRYEPSVAPPIRDTFSRINSATSLGTSDTGQAWTALVGTWGIDTSQGYVVTDVGGEAYAAIDTGLSDFTAAVTIKAASTYYGLLFRVVDGANLWLLGNDFLWKSVGGAFTSMGSTTGWTAGDVMSVQCSGSTITAYRNGVAFASITDTTFETATQVGLFSSSPVSRFDDLAVTP